MPARIPSETANERLDPASYHHLVPPSKLGFIDCLPIATVAPLARQAVKRQVGHDPGAGLAADINNGLVGATEHALHCLKARGRAAKIIQDAEAYREQTVAEAKGQASRFSQVYEQYKK